jgi:hypothetical protein
MLNMLPRVTGRARERVAREFDDLGPDVCMNSIIRDLQQHNPELLDMASKWANDVGAADRIITAFGTFYRILSAETLLPLEPRAVSPLQRVSADTRGLILRIFLESMRSEEGILCFVPTRRPMLAPCIPFVGFNFTANALSYARSQRSSAFDFL